MSTGSAPPGVLTFQSVVVAAHGGPAGRAFVSDDGNRGPRWTALVQDEARDQLQDPFQRIALGLEVAGGVLTRMLLAPLGFLLLDVLQPIPQGF